MTEPRIWRFVAPIVRSVANSRVRCAIVIESEFAITNEPTNSAIPAKARRNVRRNEMKSFVSAASVCACSLPVSTCAVGGQDRVDLVDELRVRDVGLRGDGDLVELADLLEQTLRRREVEAGERRAADREAGAELDDARHAHLLDRALRLDADRLADSEVLRRRRSPCRRRPRSDRASRPSTSVSGLKTESPLAIEKPRLGAPPDTTAFPSSPMSCVASESTLPSACATPGSARTCGSNESSSVGGVRPS